MSDDQIFKVRATDRPGEFVPLAGSSVPAGFSCKKGGVMLLDLTPAAQVQGSLFEMPDDSSSKARMVALDSINRKFGKGTLVYGTEGIKREWDMRRGFTSKTYSTSWDELLNV